MKLRINDFLYRNRGAVIIALVCGTFGVSTLRGSAGLKAFERMKDRVYSATAEERLDTDCLASERAGKRVESVLGTRAVPGYLARMKELIGCRKKEGCLSEMSQKLDSSLLIKTGASVQEPDDLSRFSYWTTRGMMMSAGEASSELKAMDYQFTWLFMVSPGRQSTLGASAAVYGSKSSEALDAVLQECEKKK